jgi:hypothetical protein
MQSLGMLRSEEYETGQSLKTLKSSNSKVTVNSISPIKNVDKISPTFAEGLSLGQETITRKIEHRAFPSFSLNNYEIED